VTDRLRILVVDDDAPARRALAAYIARMNDTVREAEDGESATSILAHEDIDVVLSDVRMPRLDGIALTRAVRAKSEDTVVVLMSAFASIENVIAAMREGAYDYLVKPIDPQNLKAALARARERLGLRRRVRSLTAAVDARDVLSSFSSSGPGIRAVLEAAKRAAQSDLSVMITGETGTGREGLARAIHGLSARASGPIVVMDFAATDPSQIETELFGAPGGNGRQGNGRVRQAHGGTLVLSDVGELQAKVQARLLELVEARNDGMPVDVRVISTASAHLDDDVRAGKMQPALFFALRVIEIKMPPLRERREDIPYLVETFLADERARRGGALKIAPQALSLLMAAPWPGNVQELDNVVQAASAMCTGDTIEVEHLPAAIGQGAAKTSTLAEQVAAYERAVLRQALESVQGQVGRAAEALGVPERTLRRKMRLFGLAKEAFRKPARFRAGLRVFGP